MMKTYNNKIDKIHDNPFNLPYLCTKICGLVLCLVLVSCGSQNKFPSEPRIESVEIVKINNGTEVDDKAVLKLHFTHGTGNIGLDDNDNYPPFDAPPYNNNFFVLFKAKRNGEFVADTNYSFNARLPRFLSSNAPEPIEGDIEYIVMIRNPLPLPSIPAVDTIIFECWLVDRDLKESNHVLTSETTVVNRVEP